MNAETFLPALTAALVLIYTAVIAPALLYKSNRIGQLEKENARLNDDLGAALIEVAKLQAILHLADLDEDFRIRVSENLRIEFRKPDENQKGGNV